MTTPGFLLTANRIAKKITPSSSTIHPTRTTRDALLTLLSIGILSGLAVTYLRTPLHLPGHKVLLWLTPLLTARQLTKIPLGATLSLSATCLTTFLLGGRLGGTAFIFPLLLLAALTLDFTAALLDRHRLPARLAVPLLAIAGLLANLLCFLNHLADPTPQYFSAAGQRFLLTAALSHALFGLLAATLAFAFAHLLNHSSRSSQ